ncbi:uncharacterized protein LOC120474294 [Pimephales promelas]|uniref:uncharacterized protein LOC120474294 n=1 Tax=Pimephales promelas TaxID=90988 RepID=UPI0019558940|nr:uncharacterized protein LOC120474294 [Pimephales promelas]
MFDMLIFCLCSWSLSGVSGVDEVKSVSVTEGESVTLNTDTEIQTDELIAWRTGHNNLIAKIKGNNFERFRDRLTLNEKTGSLTITNTRTTDSGLYKVTGSRSKTPLNIFNLTVYARLPVPVISRDCSVLRLSPNCSVVCSSVLSVCDATLSWYAGMSVLSSISVCDLSISLSLPLEVEYQDNNTYSCVLNNPVSNQTTHLDINTLCHTCAGDQENQGNAPFSAPHSPAMGKPDLVPRANTAVTDSPMACPACPELVPLKLAARSGIPILSAGLCMYGCGVLRLLSFLEELLDRGRSPSTLKVYVAAVAAFSESMHGLSIGRDELIICFLRGARRMNPPRPPSVPMWDLSLVLEALKAFPFETLDSADLKYRSLKTVFKKSAVPSGHQGSLH